MKSAKLHISGEGLLRPPGTIDWAPTLGDRTEVRSAINQPDMTWDQPSVVRLSGDNSEDCFDVHAVWPLEKDSIYSTHKDQSMLAWTR